MTAYQQPLALSSPTDSGMGGHQSASSVTDVWLTPPSILAALGPFDLDPCAPARRPWPTATRHISLPQDGLTADWGPDELVWCNPPYGPHTFVWLHRLARHPAGGIGLIFARTETQGFFDEVWNRADAALFLKGRLYFHLADGRRAGDNAGAPSVLVAYGPEAVARLDASGLDGRMVHLNGGIASRAA